MVCAVSGCWAVTESDVGAGVGSTGVAFAVALSGMIVVFRGAILATVFAGKGRGVSVEPG